MTAIVGVTAQNTTAILATYALPAWIITAQLEAVYDDIGVDAAKTGALLSAEVIAAVADFLTAHPTPLVVDPVLGASTGATLLDPEAVEVLIGSLLPLATVVTPNLAEARVLAGARRRPPGARRADRRPRRRRRADHRWGGRRLRPALRRRRIRRDPDRVGRAEPQPTAPGARIRRRSQPSSPSGRRSSRLPGAPRRSPRLRLTTGSVGSARAPGPSRSVRPRERASGCGPGRRAGRSRSCR